MKRIFLINALLFLAMVHLYSQQGVESDTVEVIQIEDLDTLTAFNNDSALLLSQVGDELRALTPALIIQEVRSQTKQTITFQGREITLSDNGGSATLDYVDSLSVLNDSTLTVHELGGSTYNLTIKGTGTANGLSTVATDETVNGDGSENNPLRYSYKLNYSNNIGSINDTIRILNYNSGSGFVSETIPNSIPDGGTVTYCHDSIGHATTLFRVFASTGRTMWNGTNFDTLAIGECVTYQRQGLIYERLTTDSPTWTEMKSYVASNGGGGGATQVDTFANYSSLAASSTDSKLIVITDKRTGGLFFLSDTTDTANNMTIIESSNNKKYVRIYNPHDFYVQWGESDDVYDDLVKSMSLSQAGAQIHFELDVTYEGYKPLFIQNGQILVSHGNSKLKRANQVKTTISQQTNAGQGFIIVANATQFKNDMEIGIAPDSLNSSLLSFANSEKMVRITSIGGDTIFIDETLSNNATVGLNVFNLGSLIVTPTSSKELILRGLTIDGNRENNTSNFGWETGALIKCHSGITIERCSIVNAVHTGVLANSDMYINDTYFSDMATAVHPNQTTIDSFFLRKKIVIENSTFQNMGLDYKACAHCDHTLEYSNGVYEFRGNGNTFKNILNGVVGQLNADDDILEFTNNLCFCSESDKGGWAVDMQNNVSGHTGIEDKFSINISSNEFWNCGDIVWLSSDSPGGNGSYFFKFENNLIRNGRSYFRNVATGNISGNTFVRDSSYDHTNHNIAGLINDADNAFVIVRNVRNTVFNDNKILGTGRDTANFLGLQIENSEALLFNGLEIKGFYIGLSSFNNSVEGQRYKLIEYTNISIDVEGPGITEEPNAIGARLSRGNILRNSTLQAKESSSGLNDARCVEYIGQSNPIDSIGVTIKGNTFRTDSQFAIYPGGVGYDHTNYSTIVGNDGSSDQGNTASPGNSGCAKDFFENSGTSAYEGTIYSNNKMRGSSNIMTPVIVLPTYLDKVKFN